MATIELLPENYRKSPQVVNLQEAFDYQVEEFKTARESLFHQLHVETATWGLAAWEKMLEIKTDVSAPIGFQRERILAKLRGAGTTTKNMIGQTAAAFSGAEVEIIDYPKESRFVIKFVGTLGIPANMADLTLAIEEIKPAHLNYSYEYIFNTHADLSHFTHNHLATYTHKQLKEGAIT